MPIFWKVFPPLELILTLEAERPDPIFRKVFPPLELILTLEAERPSPIFQYFFLTFCIVFVAIWLFFRVILTRFLATVFNLC